MSWERDRKRETGKGVGVKRKRGCIVYLLNLCHQFVSVMNCMWFIWMCGVWAADWAWTENCDRHTMHIAHHTKNNALEIQKRKIVLALPKNGPKRMHTTKHRPKRWIIVTLCAFVVARFSDVHATPKHPTNIKTNNDKSTLKINCCFTWSTIKIGVCFITLCATLSLITLVCIWSLSNDLTIG